MNTKRISRAAVASLLCAVVAYIEAILTPVIIVPGIKLGLSNIVLLLCIIYMPFGDAVLISIAKSILVSFFGGSLTAIMYSLPSTLLAVLTMKLAMKLKPSVSYVGVSVVGSLAFNVCQIAVSVVILKSTVYFYYMPYVVLVGTLTGSIIGITVNELERRKIFRSVLNEE